MKYGKFVTNCAIASFLRKTVLHRIYLFSYFLAALPINQTSHRD